MKKNALTRMSLFAIAGFLTVAASPTTVRADTGGYPWALESSCSTGGCKADKYGFYFRECTSFVAWKLNSISSTIGFSNNMRGGHFGNAWNWAANGKSIGFTVDSRPAVNAVVQLGGHVAIIKSVNLGRPGSTDDTITIEEYNWGTPGGYGQRTISVSAPDAYIHIVDSLAHDAPDSTSEDSAPAAQSMNAADVDDSSLSACTEGSAEAADIQKIIRNVFGKYGDAAIKVAKCESGSTGTKAKNGQYLGLFQMGAQERLDYGHSSCAETQARAAYSYFANSHWTWTPWSCRP